MTKKKQKNREAAKPAAAPAVSIASQKTLVRSLAIICAVFAFALYANTLGNQFTVDDDLVIAKNKFTQEGFHALPKIFSSSYRAGFYDRKESLYRPLSVALFAMEWQVAPKNPFLFHLMSVLLYAISALVLFLFLQMLFENNNLIMPFLITLLFVAHPVHTEVVANVKSSDEILAFLFSVLSLWFVLKFLKSKNFITMGLAGCFYLLALLSKESAVTIILIAPLMLFFFRAPSKNQWLLSTSIMAIVLIVYLMVRTMVLKGISNFSSIELINNSLVAAGNDWMKREATAIYLIGKYILLLFFPFVLSYDYSYNTIPLLSFDDVQALLSLVVIIALAVIAFRGFKTRSPVSFGILFFAITIAIVSNVFILIESTFAERFLYTPSLGFCIAVVFGLARILRVQEQKTAFGSISGWLKKNRGITYLFAAVLILFSIKTFSRNLDWKDNYTLLQKDVKVNPNSARILFSLGSTYLFDKAEKENDPDRKSEYLQNAIENLKKATTILNDYGEGWFNLGFAYNDVDDYKNAASCFDKGFEHSSKSNEDYFIGAGIAYGETGDYRKSFAMFDSVMKLNDTCFDAYNNKGMFQSRLHQFDSAIVNLKKAIQLNDKSSEACYNLGNTYAYMQQYATAIQWYQQALAKEPGSLISLENMGNSYAALKQYDQALQCFQKVLSVNPDNQQARYNIGITYRILGDSVKAKEFLAK